MTEQRKPFHKNINIEKIGMCSITNWSEADIPGIYKDLEIQNWAPWLAANPNSLAGRASIFNKGQFVIKSPEGAPIASLSTNKIIWNGDVKSLPSWDEVAGEPTTYEHTYQENGDTLVLMSMNVHPDYRKFGLARTMLQTLKEVKDELGVNRIIGSFRPNEYGMYKLQNKDPGFHEYCMMENHEGFPLDGWLRSLSKNGMKPLKVDEHAMVVPVSIDEFNMLKKDFWKEIEKDVFECGEVGKWIVDRSTGVATYIESNLWGELL